MTPQHADAGQRERHLDAADRDQHARPDERRGERERGQRLLQRVDAPVQRVRNGGAEQQPVVHEREPVAEAAEHEHRQQHPQVRDERAQQQVDRHAGEPGDVGTAPLPRASEARGERSEHGAQRRARRPGRQGRTRSCRARRARAAPRRCSSRPRTARRRSELRQQQPHLGATADRAQADAQVGPQRAVLDAVAAARPRGPIVVSSTAEIAKVTALAPSSAAGPTSASRPAASAGPAVSPTSSSAPNRPSAAGRRSPCASRVTPASAAGENSALPVPASAAPTTSHGSEWANTTSVKATIRSRSAAIAHVRQPTRSTSAPNSGPKRIAGSRSGISTAVTAQAECVCS